MSEVAEKEMTVLVSSHNLRELEDVCDHVGIMHHGKIMIERSLSDLQGSVSKIQVACQSGMPKLPEHFQVLHMANRACVYHDRKGRSKGSRGGTVILQSDDCGCTAVDTGRNIYLRDGRGRL